MTRTLRDLAGEQPGRWDIPARYALCKHLSPLLRAVKEFFAVANELQLDVDCKKCQKGLSVGADGLLIVTDANGGWHRNGRWRRLHG